jgi:molecular chaperone HscB
MNYFTTFNLEPSFELNLEQLDQQYFALQNEGHPDRFVNKPEEEKIAALNQTIALNQAYQTLKNPVKRMEYILSLNDINLEQIKPEQILLITMMEYQELLADCMDRESCESLQKFIAIKLNECYEEFNNYCNQRKYLHAAQPAIQAQYLTKLYNSIKAKVLDLS